MVDIISIILNACFFAVAAFAVLIGIILGCIVVEIGALALGLLRWLAGEYK